MTTMDGNTHSEPTIFKIILAALLVNGLFVSWTPAVFAQPPVLITFGGDEPGKPPSGWVSRDNKNMVKIYSVQAEGANKFLRADAVGLAVQILYEKEWPLREWPVLRWRWRPMIFPSNTNEREKRGNDSVLGVYVVLGGWPIVRAIKYVWSDTLPAGSAFNSPFSNETKIVVVRSGRSSMGTWVTEERNVLQDYRTFFGEAEKNPMGKGIAVLTDADNTNSHSVGDYAEIEVLAVGAGQGTRQ
jgi:hypothetical protein